MNRHGLRVGLVVVALVAAGLAIWWHGPAEPVSEPADAAPASDMPGTLDVGETIEPASAAGTTAAMRGPAPLPPHDAPLAQILPDLHARADAGDRRAACRLGMELLRCQHLGTWDAMMSGFNEGNAEAEYEAEGNLAAANAVAEQRLWHIERLQQCRSVPADLQGQGARYLRQAALAGEPHAMLAYAEGHHWPPTARGIAIGRDFDLWRQEAPGMLHAALRAGNPTAAFMLQLSYFDDLGFLSALVPDDSYRGYVYHLLSVRLFGIRENTAWARDLGAADMERARLEARQLHEKYFAGQQFPNSRMMPSPPYMHRGSGQSQARCGEEP